MPIIFWLMTIEDKKIREAAIRNAKLYPIPFIRVDVEFESLSDAIWYAFIWKETPEGHDYWESYYDSLFGN